MLSEKAKGKQRAVETPKLTPFSGSHVAEPQPKQSRDLVIRFTEGIPDLVVVVSPQDAVRDVKKNIRDARPQLKDRRLRLIHSGRLLTDGTFLYSWLGSLEERQNRATPDSNDGPEPTQAATTWMHCSVGPKVEAGEEEMDESKTQTAQLQPARGFDRLVSVGFSESDIANFRRQFHTQSSANYLDIDFDTEEEYDEHARALEEQWIDSIDNAGTASLSQASSASNSTVLQGILLGFFFPLLPFFFMRSSKPPVFWDDGSEHEPTSNVVFSKRMQMGLVVGFLVNVLFGMWRFLLDAS